MEKKLTPSEMRAYKFPTWITLGMIENFASMWKCFNRTPKDYFENSATKLNGHICVCVEAMGHDWITGEYFHKWNNIGWLRLKNGNVETVCNAVPIEDAAHLLAKYGRGDYKTIFPQ